MSSLRRTRKKSESMKPSDFFNEIPNYIIDKVAIVIMIFAFVYLSFITTNYSQSDNQTLIDLANQGQIAISLAIIGLVMMLLINSAMRSKGKKFTITLKGFEEESFQRIGLTMAVGVFVISLTNMFLFKTISGGKTYNITGFDLFLFAVSMAIVEEIIFSFLFQIAFEELTGNVVIGIVVRAIAFMLYHFAVYSHDWRMMLSTFIAGIVLAISLWFSKRITTNIGIHAIINAVAMGFTFSIL